MRREEIVSVIENAQYRQQQDTWKFVREDKGGGEEEIEEGCEEKYNTQMHSLAHTHKHTPLHTHTHIHTLSLSLSLIHTHTPTHKSSPCFFCTIASMSLVVYS